MRALARVVVACVALGGCGLAYHSPVVRAGAEPGGPAVRVVTLTAESVLLANASPYRPRTLPQAFAATAGTGGPAGDPAGLPDPPGPTMPPAGAIATRLPPETDPGPYRIGVGDVVRLALPPPPVGAGDPTAGVAAAQDSRQDYTVQDDGSIGPPGLGRVTIAGMTAKEAEDELFRLLVATAADPSVSLEVTEYNSRRATLGGAVGIPTRLPLGPAPVSLEEALALAGGAAVADVDSASVRLYRDGTLYQLPLAALYDGSAPGIRLADGDSVFVDEGYDPALAQASFEQQMRAGEARQSAGRDAVAARATEVGLRRAELDEARGAFVARTELGAVDRDWVYLTGEVAAQGRFPLPFDQTASLADALFDAAGGVPIETANPREIYVLRASQDPRDLGAVTAWHLDAGNAANLVLATRLELRPDDIVFVAEQPVTRWGRVIGQITPSLVTSTVAAASGG